MKRLIAIAIAVIAIYSNAEAECVYNWDGSSSSAWNTNANWSSTPGSLTPGSQIYTISGPATYTNAPVISTNNSLNVDYIDVTDGGQLTISGGTSDVDNDFVVRDGGDVIASGGTFTIPGNLHIYDDGSSFTVSGCSLIVTGTIYMGLQQPNRGDGTDGSPAFIISSGYVSCANFVFDDAEGDTPTLSISGGELEVSGDVRSDGAPVDITMSGTGVLDIGDDLNMIGSGDDFTMSGGTMYVAGDWVNLGTQSASAGTVVLDGAAAQVVNLTGSGSLYNVTLNNTSTGVTLQDPLNISNSMTFTDGVLTTTATNYLNFEDDATASGASTASYVDGPVRKTGNDAFTFPLGDGGNYQAPSISAPSSASDYFTAQYFYVNPSTVYGWGSGIIGTGLDHVSTREYWTIDRNGSSTVSVTLPWNGNSGGVTQLSDMRVSRWTGSLWEDLGGSTSGNTGAGSVTASVSTFSPFTLGSAVSTQNPLPVELLSFEVKEDETGHARLKWVTGSELNNSHFELEKSTDGEFFTELSAIPSMAPMGSSNAKLTYEFVDANFDASSYYRLTQVDFDGTKESFPLEFLSKQKTETSSWGDVTIYPNPLVSGGEVSFRMTDFEGEVDMRVLDLSGRVVFSEQIHFYSGIASCALPAGLGEGTFLISLVSEKENKVITKPIVLH